MESSLYAPWRMEYIRSLDKTRNEECFLCLAAKASTDEERRKRLVLWTTALSVVVINKFPYSNGHILVSPIAHKAELEDLNKEELLDLQQETAAVVKLLKRTVSAQGFNIGINIGRCAGAGLPGHIHQHVVPRWAGDVNFMSVVGDVRVVPQAMEQLYGELIEERAKMAKGG